MKVNKLVTLDQDLVERLRKEGINASQTINELLIKHFDSLDLLDLTKEQIEAELAIKKLEKEFEAKSKELRKNARRRT